LENVTVIREGSEHDRGPAAYGCGHAPGADHRRGSWHRAGGRAPSRAGRPRDRGEREPSIDVIVVPVGGGSGAAGACVVAKAIDPRIVVIGVQSEAEPAAYRAWREGRPVADEMHTFAEGLQTRVSFELPQRILAEHLDEFVLVGDDELRAATLQLIELTRNLVEPAGAASLAAVLKLRERLAGQRVALVCSGGNISPPQLRELLEWDRIRPRP
jgi:threonine dehydratase